MVEMIGAVSTRLQSPPTPERLRMEDAIIDQKSQQNLANSEH
jgi:hypothetical protein